MTKLKTPLLSFSAAGPLGNHLSFRRRGGLTIAERTPVLKDAHTAKQLYQRWHYARYASYWHEQSQATKLIYEKNARPLHMTGFALWMKTNLLALPNLVALWPFDELTGTTAQDFSKNALHGLITGSHHIPGVVNYALGFDGTPDRLYLGNNPLLYPTAFTIEAYFKYISGTEPTLICWDITSNRPGFYLRWSALGPFFYRGYHATGGVNGRWWNQSPVNLVDGNWHHIRLTCPGKAILDINNTVLYADNQVQTVASTSQGIQVLPMANCYVAYKSTVPQYSNIQVDELRIYNKVLPPPLT